MAEACLELRHLLSRESIAACLEAIEFVEGRSDYERFEKAKGIADLASNSATLKCRQIWFDVYRNRHNTEWIMAHNRQVAAICVEGIFSYSGVKCFGNSAFWSNIKKLKK